jgi:hypothetical protein
MVLRRGFVLRSFLHISFHEQIEQEDELRDLKLFHDVVHRQEKQPHMYIHVTLNQQLSMTATPYTTWQLLEVEGVLDSEAVAAARFPSQLM